MDKKTYVGKLKEILTLYGEASINHCPATFSVLRSIDPKTCKMCQGFVGLQYRDNIGWLSCPCFRPGPKIAIKRAWKQIEIYEKEHGEEEV